MCVLHVCERERKCVSQYSVLHLSRSRRVEHRWEVVDMTLCCDLCPPSKNGGCKSFFLASTT